MRPLTQKDLSLHSQENAAEGYRRGVAATAKGGNPGNEANGGEKKPQKWEKRRNSAISFDGSPNRRSKMGSG